MTRVLLTSSESDFDQHSYLRKLPITHSFDINTGMQIQRHNIPSTSALLAFESAARHCNFSRAAEELFTSQSAISRHITTLEERFNTRLFDRYKRKNLILTEQGQQFYRSVVSSLNQLQSAVESISESIHNQQITIACTHEISHLYLMPRFEALQNNLGSNMTLRIMTYDYDMLETSLDPRIDIIFVFDASQVDIEHRCLLFREAIRPVCSPEFAEQYADILQESVEQWLQLPILTLSKQNRGWATWDDWFESQGVEFNPARYNTRFDNYVYLLEAAAAGRGLALGWQGLIERHLENKSLVTLGDAFIESERAIHAVLTPRGQLSTAAKTCLDFLNSG